MIANVTTSVPAEKTIGEIQAMLAKIRASALMIEYTDGQPAAIFFKLTRGDHELNFRLPSNWQGILEAMKRERVTRSLQNPEQAKRVAWRVTREWLRAQLTLIEAGAASIEEVMLPWAISNDGTTVAARLLSGSTGLLALPAPEK